ncbi:MAG: hypothetical protein DI604_37030 [Delftia acidovorans]|nr:MAG: hypothetical protein DI604_37030 [Delftia acidovorans]
MLWAIQDDAPDVFTVTNSKPQGDVIAGAELVHQPAYTVGLVFRWVLVTGHHPQGSLAEHRS